MKTSGKKFRAAVATVDRTRDYTLGEAVQLVKGASFAKFDETVDVAVRLGVDPRHADQVVRGTVVLPHGTGKKVKVLVITQGDRVKEAEAAGADYAGIEYVQKLKEGWLDADIIVATPDVMGQLGQLDEPDETFVQISTKQWTICGVTVDGRIVCWGRDTAGQADIPEDPRAMLTGAFPQE